MVTKQTVEKNVVFKDFDGLFLTVCVPEILKIFSTLKSKIGSLVPFHM